MNHFIGTLTIVTTLSYHYFETAVTITHNQLILSRYNTALREVSRLTDKSHRLTEFSLVGRYSLHINPTENTAFIVGEACLPSGFLAIEVYNCGTGHLENA
jgi:hypothetical protein